MIMGTALKIPEKAFKDLSDNGVIRMRVVG